MTFSQRKMLVLFTRLLFRLTVNTLRGQPEPTDHEMKFRNNLLRELSELRIEMNNLKEANGKIMHEVRDLIRDSISQSPSEMT